MKSKQILRKNKPKTSRPVLFFQLRLIFYTVVFLLEIHKNKFQNFPTETNNKYCIFVWNYKGFH